MRNASISLRRTCRPSSVWTSGLCVELVPLDEPRVARISATASSSAATRRCKSEIAVSIENVSNSIRRVRIASAVELSFNRNKFVNDVEIF